MTVTKITFADEFKSDLINGTKTQTLRYNLTEVPEVGDELTVYLADSSEKIGSVTITNIESLRVSEVPERTFTGHRNYKNTQELLEHLGNYYNDTITPNDTLTLISFSFDPM